LLITETKIQHQKKSISKAEQRQTEEGGAITKKFWKR